MPEIQPAQLQQLDYLIGVGHYRRGRYSEAQKYFEYVISSCLINSDYQLLARVPSAAIAKARGEFSRALKLVEEGIGLAEIEHKPYQRLRLEIEKAVVMMDSRKFKEAQQLLVGLLQCAESYGDYYLLSVIFLNLGYVSTNLKSWDEADVYLQEAMKVFSSIGVRNGWAKALMNRGIALFYQNQFDNAYQCYSEATMAMENLGEISETCHGYFNLAEVCLETGRLSESREWFEKGVHSCNPKDYPQIYREFMELKPRICR